MTTKLDEIAEASETRREILERALDLLDLGECTEEELGCPRDILEADLRLVEELERIGERKMQ
jgi:hypothetical protein